MTRLWGSGIGHIRRLDRAYQEVGYLAAWFELLEGRDHVCPQTQKK